jgi:hypothetical protein
MTEPNDTTKTPLSRAEIERLTTTYGADRTRWPVASVRPTLAVVERDVALARLEAEERALDALLARARPEVTPDRLAALTDRIVAAAERTPRLAAVTLSEPPALAVSVATKPAATPARPMGDLTRRRDLRRSLAAIAASLVLGVSVGQSGLLDVAVAGFEDMTGLSLASAPVDMARALGAAETLED